MKVKSYQIWALVRNRTPGEKEDKYEYSVSESMSFQAASRMLVLKNMTDNKTANRGGIEYHTSFNMRKYMETIENITANEDIPVTKLPLQEERITKINAEEIEKRYDTDPILITPSELAGEPAVISTYTL